MGKRSVQGFGGTVQPEEKTTLEILKCKWENNIKINLEEIGWEGVERIDLAEGRDKWRVHVKAVINLRFPLEAGNFVTR
jgi:hypothetical protein